MLRDGSNSWQMGHAEVAEKLSALLVGGEPLYGVMTAVQAEEDGLGWASPVLVEYLGSPLEHWHRW